MGVERRETRRQWKIIMKDDVISRQAAIKAIYETFCYAYCDNCEKEMNEDLCGDCHRKYQNWAASKKIISKTINSLPSAERHGWWLDVEPAPHKLFYATCSVCGNRQTLEVANYCPSCGARMDEV